LILPPGAGIVKQQKRGAMRRRATVALGSVLLLGGCGGLGASVCTCPKPVPYTVAQLKAIEKAREALPRGNILQQVLVDYENERDDLRFACRPAR
jgi:hypothetical protein